MRMIEGLFSRAVEQRKGAEGLRKWLKKSIIAVLLEFVCLFVASGKYCDPWRWSFFAFIILSIALQWVFVPHDVLAARSGMAKDTQKYDLVLAPLMAWGGFIRDLVASIDARFALSGVPEPFSFRARALAFAVLIAGTLLLTASMAVNRHFTPTASIQSSHRVCDVGPYSVVRHPGYAAVALTAVSGALLVGSYLAILPAAVNVVVCVLRTVREDKFLQANLEGYKEFSTRTRFRLVPFVW